MKKYHVRYTPIPIGMTILRILKIFLQLFSGKHIYDPLVQYMQVKSFSINSENDFLNIDGENIGQTPIEVSVERNAIQLFAKI